MKTRTYRFNTLFRLSQIVGLLMLSSCRTEETTQSRARALNDSNASSASSTSNGENSNPVGSPTTSQTSWENISLGDDNPTFNIEFSMKASAANIDGVTGLSLGQASTYKDLAAVVRFAPNGKIDAINGTTYEASSYIEYKANAVYRVKMALNAQEGTYSVTIQEEGQSIIILLAKDFRFRAEQSLIASFNNLALYAQKGSHTVEDIIIKTYQPLTGSSVSPPVVSNPPPSSTTPPPSTPPPAHLPPSLSGMCESIQQHGITWTFDTKYPCGTFVNGDYWVQGPVVIKAISPEFSGGKNGTMMNAVANGKEHGLCSTSGNRACSDYRANLNIAAQLPYTVKTDASFLSTIYNNGYGSGSKNALKEAAVLTVLMKIPPEGSFRPSHFGSEKAIYTKSQLNYGAFQRLAIPASAPHPNAFLNNLSLTGVLVDLKGTGGAQAGSELSVASRDNYGRALSAVHNAAALVLNLNYSNAEKEGLLIALVQRGIDVYGGIRAGYVWNADGGHRHGRKIAMYIAGRALGAKEILHYVNPLSFKDNPAIDPKGTRVADMSPFHEDQQHFYNSKGDPDWKAHAWTSAEKEKQGGWGNGYRTMNGSANCGLVLVVSMMGDRALWNHEAMFRYIAEDFYDWITTNEDAPAVGSKNGLPKLSYDIWQANHKNFIER